MSLINVQNLTFAYDGSFKNVFENVSFQLDTNWKLGFVGRNGKCKTTFFENTDRGADIAVPTDNAVCRARQ